MRLTLVRHGQTPSNVLGLLDTAPPGPGLTDLGVLQAAAVPAALDGEPVDALFASNHVRARLTAEPLARARGLDLQVRDGLREIWAGRLEMRSEPEAVNRYIGTLIAWLEGDLGRRMPGGQSGLEVLDRFDAVVAEMARAVPADGAVVAVSHGAMIRVWATVRASNLARQLGEHNRLDNTGAVVLEGEPGGDWHALSWREEAIGGAALAAEAESGPTGESPADAAADQMLAD
ncbi:MAG TPA: histidine phosphatase family protein [Nakamurella sp.]|nr:histidine phosphatase family protein [Nakamurella sp.]